MDMFAVLKKIISDWLHRAPPVVLLSLPFLVCGSIALFLLLTLPLEGTVRYFFFAALFGVTLISRMLQTWEFGIEVHHFITFCFAFVYGPIVGILFSVSCSILVIFSAIFIGGHMFNHSVPGPTFQSLDLFLVSLIAGLLGILAPNLTLQYMPPLATFLTMSTHTMHQLLIHRYVGVDPGRLSSAVAIGALITYNLFLNVGPRMIELLTQFA